MSLNPLNWIKSKKFTTVDFGHYSIKSIQGTKSGKEAKILGGSAERVPEAAIADGQLEDIPRVVEILEKIFNELPSSPGRIVFSPICGREYVRRITVPDMPEDELQEAVRWEIEKHLDKPSEATAYDYLLLGKNEGEQVLLLVVLDQSELNRYEEVFEELSYTPQTASIQDMALVSLMEYQEECDDSFMILNMGAKRTKIMIARYDDFYLSRTVELGGDDFTEIFENRGMSYAEAEREKRDSELKTESGEMETDELAIESGFEDFEAEEEEVDFIPLADQLVSEVNRSLDFFTSRFSDDSLQRVYYTGGGFALKGLEDYLERNIELSVNPLSPFAGFAGNKPSGIPEASMAVAAGLLAGEVIHDES